MPWDPTMLSHTKTIGIHRIVRLPGIAKEVFLQTLGKEVLPIAPLTDLNRVTNVVSQTFLRNENEPAADTCLWAIAFNGVHHPELVQEKCEAMYMSVRDKLESVGVRTSFRLETPEAQWKAEL